MKKRVIRFFALFAGFVILLAFVHFSLVNFTGNVIGERMAVGEFSDTGRAFEARVDDSTFNGDKVRVYYTLEELEGRSQIIVVEARFFGGGEFKGEGARRILLEGGKTGEFISEFYMPQGGESGIIKFSNGDESQEVNLGRILRQGGITGNVTLESGAKSIGITAILVLLVFVLMIYVARFYRKREGIKTLAGNSNQKFIRLKV